ncbi:MAG: YceD family protein, partial [Panacagrimonas sp.]
MSIPVQISASRALAREERYSGPLDPAGLDRLAEFEPQELNADLRVHVGIGRQGWLEGQVAGRMRLECRVCGERFTWSLQAPVRLALAMNEEQEERLMEQGEP